ncbi:MAG: DEDD exonuclease domain-containing protein [Acidimicrobiia bacterium]|nr:DEDD exonuclease domain-containing protein [Acidimicrobiia bacterium]
MQRSFDDLGQPLSETTFCVVDVETTGGSALDGAITEVGAVKLRGGECLGTLQTLVNPGMAIPPEITVLTGITEAMVLPAPRVDEVLPSFLEFLGDAVLVGHNVRYDIGFLNAALVRAGRPRLGNTFVDTCALARRLVRDEVPDCRLGTLASRLRLGHRPTHRALDDALATGDLLHVLFERAGSLGVLGLDDLLQLPTMQGHPELDKLRLTARLPRLPGVYLFRGRGGGVLYVGKAANLRARVRSYFSTEQRRKVTQLLREMQAVDHVVCAGPLEASVLEVRLIHQYMPPFNRRSKTWRRYAYLKLTLGERFPRLSVVRRVRADDGALYLGPLPSTGAARLLAEAIETAVPIRRCTATPPRQPRAAPCAPAQLGVSLCPCAGQVSEIEYRNVIHRLERGLTTEPALLLDPLCDRMNTLAAAERFEEAADARDRAAALARALSRQRRLESLRRSGRLEVEGPDGRRVVLAGGRLLDGPLFAAASGDESGESGESGEPGPIPRDLADEVSCVAAWLDAEASRLRLVACDGELASPLPRLPSYEPRGRR